MSFIFHLSSPSPLLYSLSSPFPSLPPLISFFSSSLSSPLSDWTSLSVYEPELVHDILDHDEGMSDDDDDSNGG